MSCKLSKVQYIIEKLTKGTATHESVGISLEKAVAARDLLIRAAQLDRGIISLADEINSTVANQMLVEISPKYIEAKAAYDASKAKTDAAFDNVKEFMVKADGSIKLGLKAKEASSKYIEILTSELADLTANQAALSASYTKHMADNTLDSQRASYIKDELAAVAKAITKVKERISDNKAKHKVAATNVTKKSNALIAAEKSLLETEAKKKAVDNAIADAQVASTILSNTPVNTQSHIKGKNLGKLFSGKAIASNLARMKELLASSYQNAVEALALTPTMQIHANDSMDLMISTENTIRASLSNMKHAKIAQFDVEFSAGLEGFQNISQLLMVEGENGTRTLPPVVVTAMAAATNDWLLNVANTPKDNDWVNKFLGNTPGTPVTPEMRVQVEGLDTTLSTAAQSIGAIVTKAVGIKADTSKHYLSHDLLAKLEVEIGLIALQAFHGKKQGKHLQIVKRQATEVYGKDNAKEGVEVTFVSINPSYIEQAGKLDHKKAVEGANKLLGIESKVKKPRNYKNHTDKVFENKSKQSTWYTTASETQEALNKHENVAWEFNETYMADIVDAMENNPDSLKEHLGWVDPAGVHINYVKGVEGKNRSIEKELEDLVNIYEEAKANGDTQLFLNYFFGKNGRFYVDSNTINPQGYKSQRGAINNSAKVIETDEEVDGQNLAFAQAFGIDIDKLTIKEALKQWKAVRESLNTIDFEEHSLTDILDMLDSGKLKGGTATWHNMMGISNYRTYQKHMKEHGTIKGMEARLVAEIDGVTNGYIIKTLQMPLHGDYEVHLQSGGVFVGTRMDKSPEDIGKGEFVKDATGTGGVYFRYKSFGEQAMDKKTDNNPNGTTDNYEKPANAMAKIVPEILESFGDNDLIKRSTEIAMNGKLGSADNGTLPAVARNYMKEPFMVFNYGAGMSTILNTLIYGSVAKGAMDRFYDLVVDNSTESRDQVVAIIRASATGMRVGKNGWEVNKNSTIPANEVEALVSKYEELVDDQHLSFVLPSKFENNLASGVKAGLGQSLEKAFEPYSPYIDAGADINRSFQVMFRLFQARLDRRVAQAKEKLGRDVITDEEMDSIIDAMAESMPAIKTALGEGERDKLLIYKEASETVDDSATKQSTILHKGKFKYGKGANAIQKDGKDVVLYAKTKKRKLVESFASGSVIPIHFLDGSLMSLTLKNTDSLGIHDALLVVAGELKSTAAEYNKAVALLTKEYSLTTEVLKSFRDVVNAASNEDIAVVDAEYAAEAKEGEEAVSTRNTYLAMEKTQEKSEAKRVELLSKPIRYEQMAFEGGHYDWNMEGRPYVARTVDRPVKRSVGSSTETSSNETEYKSAVDEVKPAIITDTKGNYTRDPAEIAKELKDSCK